MACNITKGKIALACKDQSAGLKAIYFANYDDDFTYALGGNTITGIGGTDEFYKYELKNTGNNYSETITSNPDNRTTKYTQTLNFVINTLSDEMDFQVQAMVAGRPRIIVETISGEFFMMGEQLGCEISGTADIEAAIDGMNGYKLTAVAEERSTRKWLAAPAITFVRTNTSTSNIA